MGDYKKRWHRTEEDGPSRIEINAIAIYLPQFHPFPENDKAWGKGFTEWTNVASSLPRFIGHNQPFLPSDLGFYDLRIPGKIKEQVELAKKYGISGFDFYYYWFSGKKIMEMPVQTFLNDKTIDFKFSLTWANENWARVWNDEPKNIIIEQKYQENDALNFIMDIERYLLDERYIRIDGRPLLTIYRPSDIPKVGKVVATWREYWHKKHKEELFVAYVSNFARLDKKEYGFDAERNFLPLNWHVYSQHNPQVEIPRSQLLDQNFSGELRDMEKIYKEYTEKFLEADDTRFKCLSPSWDNQARRKGVKGLTFINSSPALYEDTLRKIIERERRYFKDKDIYVYINAWNEWAEAAMLEPSQNLGHAHLVATRNALSKTR
jgi:lipopolysaccharide biosynthesis protein